MRGITGFPMNSRRTTLAAIGVLLLSGGQVLAQGGTWTTKAPMPTPRFNMAAAVVDGVLYVIGGDNPVSSNVNTVQAYDPKTNAWTTKAPMPTPRSWLATGVVDGILYAVGGLNYSSGSSGWLGTLEDYDPKTNTWTTKAPMHTARSALAVAAVDGILYAVGGFDGSRATEVLEAYDPKTNTWTTKASMPSRRSGLATAVVDGILYAVGGSITSSHFTTVEAYDPKTDTWTTKAPMTTPRTGFAAATLDGMIYSVGGRISVFPTVYTNTVEAYNAQTNTWNAKPSMPTARWLLAAGVVEDTLYAVGGIFPSDPYIDPYLAVNEAFSPFLPISIDLKPGEAANTINLKSRGIIPVAILSAPDFDASTVNPDTATLAGAGVTTTGKGTPISSFRDVNRDGRLDLIVQFRTEDLQLTPTSTEAVLKGTTFSGQRIRGVDAIRLVP